MKYRVLAIRSANSMFGAAQGYCKEDGVELHFDTKELADQYADHLDSVTTSKNVSYEVQEYDNDNRGG